MNSAQLLGVALDVLVGSRGGARQMKIESNGSSETAERIATLADRMVRLLPDEYVR